MATYAIANLTNVTMGPEIVEYLERIDDTLAPFGGTFVVHGGPYDVVEGRWTGDVIVIAFADREHAHAWYGSAAYREILPLRTRNSEADVIFIETVPADHKATDVLNG